MQETTYRNPHLSQSLNGKKNLNKMLFAKYLGLNRIAKLSVLSEGCGTAPSPVLAVLQ